MPRWFARPSLLVAFAMMLAVPFATLEVPDIVAECCCPSPEVCKCPDHRGERISHTSMRSCHRTAHHLSTSKLAAFAPVSDSLALLPPPAVRLVRASPTSTPPAAFARPPDVPS